MRVSDASARQSVYRILMTRPWHLVNLVTSSTAKASTPLIATYSLIALEITMVPIDYRLSLVSLVIPIDGGWMMVPVSQ